nr:DUF87 domain-containing protein [Candidatus Njordarchaeota archaeon]
MENSGVVRVRRLGWKRRLIVGLVVVVVFLVLVLRLLGSWGTRALASLCESILSFAVSLVPFAVVCFTTLASAFVLTRRQVRMLFLFRRKTYSIVVHSSSKSTDSLSITIGRKTGFAVSMLRLFSVPSEGVRMRVRGAVSKDELEWGAAVSDERQYQFSHLESAADLHGVSYTLRFSGGLVDVGFTVTGRNEGDCVKRRNQVKAAILGKFPVQLAPTAGKPLVESVVLGLFEHGAKMGGDSTVHIEAVGDSIARLMARETGVGVGYEPRYVAVVALRGRPEMSAHEQRSQIDQFIAGVNSLGQGDCRVEFVVSFEPRAPPKKHPSDAKVRRRLIEKPDIELSLERKRIEVDAMEAEFGERAGWWKVSSYAVVAGGERERVELAAHSVARLVKSVWSGSHFAPECDFLHSKEIVKYFPRILRRDLLSKRYVTEMSSVRLSSLVHIPEEPHPPLKRGVPPTFEVPDLRTVPADDVGASGCFIRFGDVLSPTGEVLYPLALHVTTLGTHVNVFGESGRGKTCFTLNILRELLHGRSANAEKRSFLDSVVPFLVLDQKGEYRCLVSRPEDGVVFFLPSSDAAPLRINLFDPQGDDAESHAKYVFHIIREILFTNRTELTPQMERVLYDVMRMSVGGNWETFNDNLAEYVAVHGDDLPQLGATVQGILNRVGAFTRSPLSHVFNCKQSNVNFSDLVERCVVVDLSEVRKLGTPEDVRLLANIIAKYVSVASVKKGVDYSGELRHLFVVDDALDVVPEILSKKTTAEVGIIEYMAMLLRATGQGLVVVSQRPNVSENVIANSAMKVFFRTVVDSRDVASWLNLNEEQQAYLKVLPKEEAIMTIPEHPAPIRVRALDVGDMLQRRVTWHEIIVNNMMNYPLMYDMEAQQEEEAYKSEKTAETGSGEGEKEVTKAKETHDSETGGEKEQPAKQEQWETALRENGVTELTRANRETWTKLRDYFERGLAFDSDFVSKMVGVSKQVAHRSMLALRSAGLVAVAKIPNYAYGEGFQYLYYSGKSFLGGGVVGYVREKLRDDLEGRETVVELSPKDVPNADMVVQHDYPLVIHVTSIGDRRAKEGGLRLSALNERIHRVVETLTIRNGLHMGCSSVNGSRTVVVTLWRRAAEELNEARREGRLKGCLCVIPFTKKSVEMLADYVLNHIKLQTLLGEGENGEKEEAERKEAGEGIREEDTGRESEGGSKQKSAEEKEKDTDKQEEGRQENEGSKVVDEQLREKVFLVVRKLVGVEPRIVAERLGVPLWRVSVVVRKLKEEGIIKVVRNLPYLASLKKANATYYLDSSKPTALHDTVMNIVWEWNIALGGKSRDFNFQCSGKTWCTDGLLVNTGGSFLLEVVAGNCTERVVEQLGAYSTQIGHMNIKGAIIVALDSHCLDRIREEVIGRGVKLGEGWFLTTLRSKDEKLQFRNLLLGGKTMAYHQNPTS